MSRQTQPRKVTVVQGKTTIHDYRLPVNEALELLEGIIKQIQDVPSEYKDNVVMEPQFEEGGGDYSPELEITVSYWRYETEEERQAGEDGEARTAKLKELDDRKLYEKLKARFEPTRKRCEVGFDGSPYVKGEELDDD